MSKKTITILPGDGIGPAITDATLKVLDALGCDFSYERADCGITSLEQGDELIPQRVHDLINKNKIALKGPITTPVGDGFTSINVTLRKIYNLYANVRPVVSYPGTRSRYEDIDIITIRENTEGMYSGEGQIIDSTGARAESLSVITRQGAVQVITFAYELARKLKRKKVTLVHKANILKTTSGLFLDVGRTIAEQYPEIESTEMIVDNTCMQLVMDPDQFDMIVTTNLFGDILSDLCAGLVGGLGMAPGANIGDDAAIFEAVHGSAPDIAGQNIANPTALMLAAAMMLDYLDMKDKADVLRNSIKKVLQEGKSVTRDLGGSATTDEYTDALIAAF